MFEKFYLICIHALLSFDFIVANARIPASKCMQIGWDQCNIRQIDISPADRTIDDNSCFVDRGSNITISFNFTPHFETYNLKWGVWVETVIGDYKVDGIPSDARNFSYHPTRENEINPFRTVVHIPNRIRTKLWVLRVTIMGDNDQDLCCFLCDIRVREPQTTTSSSTTFDPTNLYDIVRKQVSFPSIWDFNEVAKKFQNDSNIFNKFVFDKALATHRPSYLKVIKNAFKRLLGIRNEPVAPAKVPFLGNASSLMDYLSGAVLAKDDKNKINQMTTSVARETSVNTESECTKKVITEETTFAASASSSNPRKGKTVEGSEADSDHEDVEDDKTRDSENDSSEEETTPTPVQTTCTKLKSKIRTSLALRKKTIRSGSASAKVARAGIKKTVRAVRPSRPIAKSTTS